MTLAAPGVCRHCRRAEGNLLRGHDGDEYNWGDRTRTWCTSPSCVNAERTRKQKATAEDQAMPQRKYGERYRGTGYGAIVEDLRKRARSLRRKKRAA